MVLQAPWARVASFDGVRVTAGTFSPDSLMVDQNGRPFRSLVGYLLGVEWSDVYLETHLRAYVREFY